MNCKKYFLSFLTLLMVCGLMSGCTDKEKKEDEKMVDVLRCMPKDADVDETLAGNIIDFVVADDGITAEKIIYQEEFTEEFMKKWMPEEMTLDESYKMLETNAYNILYKHLHGHEDEAWIDGNVYTDREHYHIVMTIMFDVGNEDFEVNEKNMETLSYYRFNLFYNEDEKRFEANADLLKEMNQNLWDCSMIEVKSNKKSQ